MSTQRTAEAARWITESFDLSGRRVEVSVRRISDEEAGRMAAHLAWFASIADAPGADVDATGWPELLKHIMANYVSLHVDTDTLERLPELRTPLCAGALRAFVRANAIHSRPNSDLLTSSPRPN